jgi:hypothetical protein
VKRRAWVVAAVLLAIASVAALALLASTEVISSALRDPLVVFAAPGTTAWWFVLGGPFRNAPFSPAGIAFAAVANTVFWLLLLWAVVAAFHLIREKASAK